VLRSLAVLVGAALSVGGNLPYIAAVRRGDPDARPRLASWVIWSAALCVGTAAAGLSRAWTSLAYTAACAAGCLAVLACGWRYGTREFGRLDAICFATGLAGVVSLTVAAVFPQMLPVWAATTAAAVTDVIAFLPTYRNGWRGGEPWKPYAMYGIGAALALAVADFTKPAGVIYTAYLAASDGAMTAIVLYARAVGRRPAAEPGPESRRDGPPLPGKTRAGCIGCNNRRLDGTQDERKYPAARILTWGYRIKQ
jgi:hypothetical protein